MLFRLRFVYAAFGLAALVDTFPVPGSCCIEVAMYDERIFSQSQRWGVVCNAEWGIYPNDLLKRDRLGRLVRGRCHQSWDWHDVYLLLAGC